jgi:two-component system cell cycle sensor histidine kinase/response regulator CckA
MAAETILLLDDDPATINVLRDVLQEKGRFTVLTAVTLEQAFGLCQQHHQSPIVVLISDIMLRQLGRKEITAQMRNQLPGMGLLLISGYAVEDLVKRGCLELRT